jgi:4-hydroxybenzoate polyprenyltransferase
MQGILAKTRIALEMIKWEHSIFALPFALTAVLLAAHGLPGWRTLVWILVAMVAARSAAMAFNRWADADLDAANPRTRMRAIPAGLLSRQFVLAFTVSATAVFLVAAGQLNRLTLALSPVVLVVLFGYSYMKRITRWSHLVLGLALGLAPSAAWIAVRGSLDPRIVVLTAAVTLWVGGFDVLYACQDFDHDRSVGLHSLPQATSISAAFWAARLMHLVMLALLAWFALLMGFGVAGWIGIASSPPATSAA